MSLHHDWLSSWIENMLASVSKGGCDIELYKVVRCFYLFLCFFVFWNVEIVFTLKDNYYALSFLSFTSEF